jgi:hypothetical protein
MKSPKTASKILTISLSPELYSQAHELARLSELSLNGLVQHSLLATIRESNEKARYAGYTMLGEDVNGCDISYAVQAQAEVMLGDEA